MGGNFFRYGLGPSFSPRERPRDPGVYPEAEALAKQGKLREAMDLLAPWTRHSSSALALFQKFETLAKNQSEDRVNALSKDLGAKLDPLRRKELASLAQIQDSRDFYEALLHFAQRLKLSQDLNNAAPLFSMLAQSAKDGEVPSAVRE